MFDKFGPLTYEELNKTAEGLKMEGDIESLILLAEENGLEKEDAEDYADEVVDTFTTPVEAAIGKIKVESEHLNLAHSTTLSGMRDLIIGFSLLNCLEFFVFRKMKSSSTINHPLCGCESNVIQKKLPFRVQ